MYDIFTQIHALKRAPLLVRAARFGLDDYQRNRHLSRALHTDDIPGPAEALIRLLEAERAMNDLQATGDGGYTIARHVEVLIAIMGEARLLKATARAALAAP